MGTEMSKDEATLIRRAREGDPSAFAEIYDRYQSIATSSIG